MAEPEAAKERAAAPITAAISLANLFILVILCMYSGFIPFLETQLTDLPETAFSFSSHSQYSQKPPEDNDIFIKDITNCEKSPELCFWKAGKEPLPAPAQLPETGASGENAGSPGFGKQKSGGPRRRKEKEKEKIKKRTAPGQGN